MISKMNDIRKGAGLDIVDITVEESNREDLLNELKVKIGLSVLRCCACNKNAITGAVVSVNNKFYKVPLCEKCCRANFLEVLRSDLERYE